MRLPTLPLLTGLLLTLASVTSSAEVLAVPEGEPAAVTAKPAKGLTMQAVQQQFGAPFKKHAPVGGGSRRQPPITRWDYPGFSVFFEHGHVIDAVVPGAPPPVQHREELKPLSS